MAVLDLGVGTGNLTARFVAQGCRLWGLDFSSEMLVRARQKLPEAVLVQADLLRGWPAELDRRFDRIVSAYLFHEFEMQTKVDVLHRLVQEHLAEQGCVVVGDISFPSMEARTEAQVRLAGYWDDEEYYWAADEAAEALAGAGLAVAYEQVSFCAGIYTIELERWPEETHGARSLPLSGRAL
jgi:putative AdoMet-dependent methyltransferase